jgi:hypothetical protein
VADSSIQQGTDSVEYGDQQAVDAQAAAMPAAPPAIDPAAIAQSVTGNVTPQQAAPGYTVKNPYMLLPSRVNFNAVNGQKSQVERDYDIGSLWEALAADPRSSDTARMVARQLMNRGE